MTTTTKQPRVRFTCVDYERSHGASPRGRGSWAFRAHVVFRCRLPDFDCEDNWGPTHTQELDEMFWVYSATFTEARKRVRVNGLDRVLAKAGENVQVLEIIWDAQA